MQRHFAQFWTHSRHCSREQSWKHRSPGLSPAPCPALIVQAAATADRNPDLAQACASWLGEELFAAQIGKAEGEALQMTVNYLGLAWKEGQLLSSATVIGWLCSIRSEHMYVCIHTELYCTFLSPKERTDDPTSLQTLSCPSNAAPLLVLDEDPVVHSPHLLCSIPTAKWAALEVRSLYLQLQQIRNACLPPSAMQSSYNTYLFLADKFLKWKATQSVIISSCSQPKNKNLKVRDFK